MAVGTVSGIDPTDNWQLIATNTLTAAASTTFSSLSGYKTYMVINKVTQSTGNYPLITFNGDTTAGNYGSSAFWTLAGSDNKYTDSGIIAWAYSGGGVGTFNNYTIIQNADKSVPKITQTGGYLTYNGTGIWNSTAAITSITFTVNTGTITGSIALYGIPA